MVKSNTVMASRKIFSEEEIKEIAFLYVNTPCSTRDISTKFRVSYNMINVLLKYGIIK